MSPRRGERRAVGLACRAAQAHLPSPPGEGGRELLGPDAITAMHQALLAITQAARLKFTLGGLEVRPVGIWIVVTLRFWRFDDVTLRVSRVWAETLYRNLGKALGRDAV